MWKLCRFRDVTNTGRVYVALQAPTRRLLFREFIVYDHAKCYPEFLIEYQRYWLSDVISISQLLQQNHVKNVW